jgi:hypothetical protein
VKKGNAATPQVKVRWLGLPETSYTWEDRHVLVSKFPIVSSWGQNASGAGGGVTHVPVLRAEESPSGKRDVYELDPLVQVCTYFDSELAIGTQ